MVLSSRPHVAVAAQSQRRNAVDAVRAQIQKPLAGTVAVDYGVCLHNLPPSISKPGKNVHEIIL